MATGSESRLSINYSAVTVHDFSTQSLGATEYSELAQLPSTQRWQNLLIFRRLSNIHSDFNVSLSTTAPASPGRQILNTEKDHRRVQNPQP